ncbi:type I secretion protein [Enterovibrio sp. 27052020O]|uniref:calcium-binding protein n=1 Tax=Enterovibrio sp. 27052020O TaxID=3241166 RepID=UPI00388D3C4B
MSKINGTKDADFLYGNQNEKQNLLVNGDMESWGNDSGSAHAQIKDHDFSGWYTHNNGPIEVHQGQGKLGKALGNSDSNTVIDLDGGKNNKSIQQDVDVSHLTKSGDATLSLSFDYANQYKIAKKKGIFLDDTSPFEVKVFDQDGNVIFQQYFDNTQSNDHFVNFDADVVIPEGTSGLILKFTGHGKADGSGALIDNVALTASNTIDDVIDGGDGNDTIFGESGDDVIHGGNGNDNLQGGDGNDVIYGDAAKNLIINGDMEGWGDNLSDATAVLGDHQFLGWYTPGAYKITAHQGAIDGLGENSQSNTVLDMNVNGHLWVQQEVATADLTAEGDSILALSFNYAFREQMGEFENSPLNVVVLNQDGEVIYQTQIGALSSTEGFLEFNDEIVVPQGVESIALRFSSSAQSENLGALIDNVSLTQVVNDESNDDTIRGGDGDDVIYGDAGDDNIRGDNGNDVIYGGSGNDTINGGNGDDVIYGGDGDDTLLGASGNDSLYGGAGNDYLQAGYEDDIIMDGGEGLDIYVGSEGNDTMIFDQSDFSDLSFLQENKTIYVGDRGFDKILVDGDANVDLTGKSYGITSGPKPIAQVEAIVAAGEGDQTVTANAYAIDAQSDDFQSTTSVDPGAWDGFVAYLGEGDDTFNLEAVNWNYDADATSTAVISAEQIAFMGLTDTQVSELDAYVFVKGDNAITIWTDAEHFLQDGQDIFGM